MEQRVPAVSCLQIMSLEKVSIKPKIILKQGRAKPFYGRHPWVFAGAIASVEPTPTDGDEVELISSAGNFIATGLYNSHSKIQVRLYTWNPDQNIDRDFFKDKFEQAIELRKHLGLFNKDGGCRLFFSEADGLSGLCIDKYSDWLVMQFTSLALANRREMIADILQELIEPAGIYLRTEKGIGKLEGLALQDELFRGTPPDGPIPIQEHGIEFRVNLAEGQKTGFYLDQRENRLEAAKLAKGRRVLDVFCYSGGFGLHALKHGALESVGIDQSEPALLLAADNAARNNLGPAKWIRGSAFESLAELAKNDEKFGLIVLDPPKFARSRSAIDEALNGYRRLHTLALKLLEPSGFLVSCCCSGLITMDMMEQLLAQVGADEKRNFQILQRRGPSPDHPVSANCLESHYLKCIITRVV